MTPAAERIRLWLHEPQTAYRQLFNDEPDVWQENVLKAFSVDNPDPRARRIGLQSCVGAGKTRILAALALIFGSTRPDSKVPCLSITEDNLRDNLWAEIAELRRRSPYLLSISKYSAEAITFNANPAYWRIMFRRFAKTADRAQLSSALKGIHGKYVLFLIDESGDMPPAVLETADAALSGGIETRMVTAGNPTSLEGGLYYACVENAAKWLVFVISSAPDAVDRAKFVDVEWSKSMILKYGADNPWVMSSIYGQFPKSSLNTLISPDQVREAMGRQLVDGDWNWMQKRLGTDVAFVGGDLTVHAPRQGLMWMDPVVTTVDRGHRDWAHQIAARIVVIKHKWHQEMDIVDATGGYGEGVISALHTMNHDAYPYVGSGEPSDPMFANKVSECWWNMIEAIKSGASLPDCPELIPELSKRTYTSRNGKLMIQPKDLYKRVLGRSPNYADAYAMTFAIPDQASKEHLEGQRRRRQETAPKKYDGLRRFRGATGMLAA